LQKIADRAFVSADRLDVHKLAREDDRIHEYEDSAKTPKSALTV
jgi:hypothetical protein